MRLSYKSSISSFQVDGAVAESAKRSPQPLPCWARKMEEGMQVTLITAGSDNPKNWPRTVELGALC